MSAVSKRYFRALTIAGSDSGGGAGIQADLKTFGALGCFGMTAITAITAQNTQEVLKIFPQTPEIVAEQIRAVLEDIGADAIKIGMLVNEAIIEVVAKELLTYPEIPVVLDPVLVSKSNHPLIEKRAIQALKALFPLTTLLTPNLSEASTLVEYPVQTPSDMEKAGKDLLSLGPKAVLIKGGHLSQARGWDCLLMQDELPLWLEGTFVKTRNTHGTGCTYSAAITAYLARGFTLKESVILSKRYIQKAIAKGALYDLGKGHGPLHHFFESQAWSL